METKTTQITFGTCKRCKTNPAVYGGLYVCKDCFVDWNKLGVFEGKTMDGYLLRKKATGLFFENAKMEKIMGLKN